MAKLRSLNITGHQKRPIKNTFIEQDNKSKGIAILFPGVGYTATMPLLYYSERLLNWLGFDVLRIEDSPYRNDSAFAELNEEAKALWLFNDATQIGRAALSIHKYEKIVLVGKSIGTLSMGHLIASHSEFKQAVCVCLTPLIKNFELVQQIQVSSNPSLFVIGTHDAHYDADLLSSLAKDQAAVVIENAGHSLNIEANLNLSLEALQETMLAVEGFLNLQV